MRNLAGVKTADEAIQEELILAGIDAVNGARSSREVPYSITGQLGIWTLDRAWGYWIARGSETEGLPLEVAIELHNLPYPIVGEKQPKAYGQVVRVDGHCGCPSPEEYARHFDDRGNLLVLDPQGKQEDEMKQFFNEHQDSSQDDPTMKVLRTAKYVQSLERVTATAIVNSYHIDNQLGLNMFAEMVNRPANGS